MEAGAQPGGLGQRLKPLPGNVLLQAGPHHTEGSHMDAPTPMVNSCSQGKSGCG